MLEQQQGQLVSGLQEMYHRMRKGEAWTGRQLHESNGQPLTHDILADLGLLEAKSDGSGEFETFEDDFDKIQSRLVAGGAEYVHRRSSFSSDSDRSQLAHSKSKYGTPPTGKPPVFDKNFTFSASPSPAQSPVPRQRKSHPPVQQSLLHRAPPKTNDPQLYQANWTGSSFAEPEDIMRSNFALKPPQLNQSLDQIHDMFSNGQWDDAIAPYELNMGINPYQEQLPSFMGQYTNGPDYASMTGMDLDPDYKQFIQVAT